jgi:hypothetical protein
MWQPVPKKEKKKEVKNMVAISFNSQFTKYHVYLIINKSFCRTISNFYIILKR